MAVQDGHRKQLILTTTNPFEKVPDGFDVYENFTCSIYNGYTTYQSRKNYKSLNDKAFINIS